MPLGSISTVEARRERIRWCAIGISPIDHSHAHNVCKSPFTLVSLRAQTKIVCLLGCPDEDMGTAHPNLDLITQNLHTSTCCYSEKRHTRLTITRYGYSQCGRFVDRCGAPDARDSREQRDREVDRIPPYLLRRERGGLESARHAFSVPCVVRHFPSRWL